MERRITVRGIIYKDGKLFAQTIKQENGESNYWCTPGGGLDPKESLLEGLHREMIEETGIAPDIGELLFIQQYSDSHKEFLEFFFHIKNPDDYHTIELSKTSHGMIEIERCEFIDPRTENIMPAFLQTLPIDTYINGTLPVLISSLIKK